MFPEQRKINIFIIIFSIFFSSIDFDIKSTYHISSKTEYKDLVDFAYEELLLTVLADQWAKGEDQKKIIQEINNFVATHISADPFFPQNAGALMTLVLGNSLCSSYSWILRGLMEKKGIQTRMACSKHHAFAEVLFNGKWILDDPSGGLVYTNNKGDFFSVEEVLEDLLKKNEYEDFLKTNFGENIINNSSIGSIFAFSQYLGEVYKISPPEPLISDYTFRSTLKKMHQFIVKKFIEYGYKIFGTYFSSFMQDLYLKYLDRNIESMTAHFQVKTGFLRTHKYFRWEKLPILEYFSKYYGENAVINKKDSFYILKARHYQLFGFFHKAQAIYQSILSKTKNLPHKSYVSYHYAELLHDHGDYLKAIEILLPLEEINKKIHRNNKMLYYLLGSCYEKKNLLRQALTYYYKSAASRCSYLSEWNFKRASKKIYELEHRNINK